MGRRGHGVRLKVDERVKSRVSGVFPNTDTEKKSLSVKVPLMTRRHHYLDFYGAM